MCYFTKDMPNHSIQQINQILQQQNGGGGSVGGGSSTKQKDKLSRKINEFLYQQEHNPPGILYRFKQYSKGYRIINYQTFQDFIYLTISNGFIIKFKWSNYQFSNLN